VSYKRQYCHGFTGGLNYTLGLGNSGNLILQPQLVHSATGAISFSPNQSALDNLINNAGFRRITIKGFAVWDLPKVPGINNKALDYVVNGWQISTAYTPGNGAPYDVGYS
jgi:hypothetical protein